MKAHDVIRGGFERSKMVTDMLLGDLTDADLMERPVPAANHLAWQLGHLISSLRFFGETIRAQSMPALPAGFDQQHGKETANCNDAAAFLSKHDYLQLLDQQRAALVNLLNQLSDDQLSEDAPPDVRSYAPKVGDMLEMAAAHELMHSGQFTVLRRKLGKAVAF
jgi:uncharacterized damage-inducible protein DinB